MGGFIVVITLAFLVIIIVAKTAVVVPQQTLHFLRGEVGEASRQPDAASGFEPVHHFHADGKRVAAA